MAARRQGFIWLATSGGSLECIEATCRKVTPCLTYILMKMRELAASSAATWASRPLGASVGRRLPLYRCSRRQGLHSAWLPPEIVPHGVDDEAGVPRRVAFLRKSVREGVLVASTYVVGSQISAKTKMGV